MRHSPTESDIDHPDVTPQSLLLAFLGMHLLWRPIAFGGASIVEVFGWLGVGPTATRSLLARMTDRGLLGRHKVGRKTYYSLTEDGTSLLENGSKKMWRGVGDADWDGLWTTVAISVPEDSRHLRHRARSRLNWAGFGNTRSGLWVAPRRHDVAVILGSDFAGVDLTVMVSRVMPPTTDEMLVTSAFDLRGISTRYSEFIACWQDIDASASSRESAFGTRIRLQAEWLSITRTDPLLPTQLLPNAWPAGDAERLFRISDATLARETVGLEGDGIDAIEM